MEVCMYYLTVAVSIQAWHVTSSVNTNDSNMDLQINDDVLSQLLNRVEELVSLENERKAEMNTLRAVIRQPLQEVRFSELEHAQKDRKGLRGSTVNTLLENDEGKGSHIDLYEAERILSGETKLRETKGRVTYQKPSFVLLEENADVQLNMTPAEEEQDSVNDRKRKLITSHKRRKTQQRRQDVVNDVAFYAVVDSHHLTNLGAKQRIEFDRVVTNIGHAYRPDIGAFISPVSGTYVFSATLMGLNHHNAHYYISHNRQAVANMFIHGQDSYLSSSSRTVVLYLHKGDEVSVRNMNVTEGVLGFQFSSFSGFLKGTEIPAKAIVG